MGQLSVPHLERTPRILFWLIGIKRLVSGSLRTSWLAVYRRKPKPLKSSVVSWEVKVYWSIYTKRRATKQLSMSSALWALGHPWPTCLDFYTLKLLKGFCPLKGKASLSPREDIRGGGHGVLPCKPTYQQSLGHRSKSPPQQSGSPLLPPHPQPLLINILDVELNKWSIVFQSVLLSCQEYYSWGREMGPFERFSGEIVKDKNCMKGENPSVSKMFLMPPQSTLWLQLGPPGMKWPLMPLGQVSLKLECVLGTLLLVSPQPPVHLCVAYGNLCYPSSVFLRWMK